MFHSFSLKMLNVALGCFLSTNGIKIIPIKKWFIMEYENKEQEVTQVNAVLCGHKKYFFSEARNALFITRFWKILA